MSLDLVPLHMGALHPVEQALTLALAFGPFAILALVIVVRRRHDPDDDPGAEVESPATAEPTHGG